MKFTKFLKSGLWLCTLCLIVTLVGGCGTGHDAPVAFKGILDLSQWNFDGNGPVRLNGEWEFYPGVLLAPEDFPVRRAGNDRQYAILPHLWKACGHKSGKSYPQKVATYSLTVKINSNESELALSLSRPLSVAKIWCNGRLIGKTGEVGTDKKFESPQKHVLFSRFSSSGNILTFVLQVSNSHNMQGGLSDPVIFGPERVLQPAVWQNHIVTALLGGGLLVMAILHLFFYVFRRSESANLYFGLYCLMQSIALVAGDMRSCLLEILIPGLSWPVCINLIIVSISLSTPLMVLVYQAIFPRKNRKPVALFYGGMTLLFLVYVALTPPNAYDRVLVIFSVFSMTAFPYLMACFIMDIADQREGAGLLVPGFLVLGWVLSIEISSGHRVFEPLGPVPLAMFMFIFSFSLLLSRRYLRLRPPLQPVSSPFKDDGDLKISRTHKAVIG